MKSNHSCIHDGQESGRSSASVKVETKPDAEETLYHSDAVTQVSSHEACQGEQSCDAVIRREQSVFVEQRPLPAFSFDLQFVQAA